MRCFAHAVYPLSVQRRTRATLLSLYENALVKDKGREARKWATEYGAKWPGQTEVHPAGRQRHIRRPYLALPAKGVAKPSPSIILPACQDRMCRQLLPTRSQVPGLAPWGSHIKQRVPYAAFVQTVALIPQLTYARTALYCCARTRNCCREQR